MSYDSKTYGQSPFGNSAKPDSSKPDSAQLGPTKPGPTKPEAKQPADDGLDQGPGKAGTPGLASRFPTISTTAKTVAVGSVNAKTASASTASSAPGATKSSSSKRSKSSSKTSRKSKKTKEAEAAKAEAEAVEAAIARRFREEDQRAYLSLLQKTGISGLVWAVLRLSVYELPDDAIAIVNIIIHPLLISTIAFAIMVGLTFWLRTLLNDLARHTQQLQIDAEDEKNNRPTLEILGDSLEYNPQLRKSLARLFNVSSILICSLVSYFLVIGLNLVWKIK